MILFNIHYKNNIFSTEALKEVFLSPILDVITGQQIYRK